MISLIFAMVVATFAVSSAHPMEKRQANGRWSLYAYGRNIDEFPIFYADGQAQIGNLAMSNATTKFPVSLTFGDNQMETSSKATGCSFKVIDGLGGEVDISISTERAGPGSGGRC
ncbi:uncharacterized protein N7487_000623 [Penicillium crustosum]|uniref:uncharacterized protein n=1 Tax=Penicillium crustosum TaxID=36656 RepID=UPI0023996974|nr:uncharacterized protein N7487_000623 [Penicillium crustosum]KAJ5417073.1 hypothetical protein N7487_000623 [Penicillium crustosum]